MLGEAILAYICQVNEMGPKTVKSNAMDYRPLVSIISVNFNETQATLEMLASLEHSTYTNYEVIVVDNGSRENPEEKILNRFPNTRFIRSNENLGFAGGNNLALARATGDFLFFINNDTEIIPGLINRLVSQFNKIPDLGVISPKIYYHPSVANGRENLIQYMGATEISSITGRNITLGAGELDFGQFRKEEPTPYAHGAAMMISREALDRVGPLPEFFFLYYEELDWCEMFKRAGFKIYVDPGASIYHKESLAVGQDSPMKTYFLTRNRLLFMRRNQPTSKLILFTLFLLLIALPKNLLVYALKGKWKHAKALIRGILWNLSNPKDRITPHGWKMA